MARIHYSLSGEGRGHATRSRAILDEIADRHEITVHAYGDALPILEPFCARRGLALERLPGLRFAYGRGERLDYLRTGLGALRYLKGLPGLVARLAARLKAEKVDLVVTDFEPALPRAARRAGVPFLSIDHQHFLTAFDLSRLPRPLRWRARFCALSVPLFCPQPAETVVSAFYRCPPRRGAGPVRSVGVLLDESLRSASPRRDGHLVAYLRRRLPDQVLGALAEGPLPVRVYGPFARRAPEGRVSFHEISRPAFVRDLARAEALITTAGNQVLGEAFALGKPVLAIPEPGNYEQEINGWFLEETGAGETVAADEMDPARLTAFVERLQEFRARVVETRPPGNREVQEVIEAHLPERARPEAPAAAPRPTDDLVVPA